MNARARAYVAPVGRRWHSSTVQLCPSSSGRPHAAAAIDSVQPAAGYVRGGDRGHCMAELASSKLAPHHHQRVVLPAAVAVGARRGS